MRQTMPYGTARWKKLRAMQLGKAPLCAFCLRRGVVTAASVADHVEPHRGDLRKFWHGALQSLCKRCHDSDKQAIEKGGKVYGEDGWPI